MDLIFTPECYTEYFVKFNFSNGSCFKTTLSKLSGLLIIVGSSIAKVPQLMKIYENKSGEGISVASVTLELMAYTIYMSYNFVKDFPFTAWGEIVFLALQTMLIGMLVLHYNGETEKAVAYVATYLIVCFTVISGIVPVDVLWAMQGVNIFILLLARLTQAYTNYANGHTGKLSAVTTLLLFLGSLIRIFTSIQETGDFIVILANTVGCVANAIIIAQIWYYWEVTKEKVS